MTKRSVGVLALIGLAIGVLGSWATGCDLGSGGTVGIDDNPEDMDTTTQEQRAPATGEELSSPKFLKQLDEDH
jgi:hypothetical protein